MKKLPILLLLLVLLTFQLHAQKSDEPVISLTGTAKQFILPDLAIINLVIKIESADEGKVLQKVQETVKFTSNKMQEFGFKRDQMKLTDFSLQGKYTHKKNEGRIRTGYIGQQTVKIKTTIDQETISRFLEYISKNKVENTTINFTTALSEDLEQKTRLQLVETAIENAKVKAKLMAKSSSVSITGISKISYNEDESDSNNTMELKYFANEEVIDEQSEELNITSLLSIEEIEIKESVSVVYQIKNNL